MRGLRRAAGARSVMTGVLLAMLIAVLPATALGQEDGASVRVVHGVSDAGPLDLYIDGAIAVVGATFPSVTDPLSIEGGEHRIVVAPSGSGIDAALVDSTRTIEAGTTAEIAVAGSVAGLNAVLFEVDRSALADDQARIRVVNASPDAGPIDASIVGGGVIFPSVDYLLATEYAEVAAGVYPLELQLASGAVDPLAVPDLALEAGTVTDVYVVGQVADGTLQPLLVGARALGGVRTGTETETEQGDSVRAPTADSGPRPSSLRAGTCEALGDEVAAISEVTAATGVEVGPQSGVAIANGFATVPVAFDAIVAADHAIVVGDGVPAACGAVGGRLTDDGSLVVPLLADTGAARGVAVLFPNVLDPTATDISVFFVPQSTSDDSGSAADGAAEPVASGSGEEPPVTVTIEAVGTPAVGSGGSA